MASNSEMQSQIRRSMEQKNTEELLEIWEENDRTQYSYEAFKIISEILADRGIAPPPQRDVATEPTIPLDVPPSKATLYTGVAFILLSILTILPTILPGPFELRKVILSFLAVCFPILVGGVALYIRGYSPPVGFWRGFASFLGGTLIGKVLGQVGILLLGYVPKNARAGGLIFGPLIIGLFFLWLGFRSASKGSYD